MLAAGHGLAEIVVVRNTDCILPVQFSEKSSIGVLMVGENADCPFADYCCRYYSMPVAEVSSASQVGEAEIALGGCETIIVGVFTSDRWAVDAVTRLGKGHNMIVSFFIDDSKVSAFSNVSGMMGIVVAGSKVEGAQVRAAEAIFGGDDVTGRLSKGIPGIGRKGAGYDIEKVRLGYTIYNEDIDAVKKMSLEIDSIVKESINAKAFPGCQVVVVLDGTVVFDEAFGTLKYKAGSRKTLRSTLYDVASVTKATATIGGLMCAYDDGLFKTDGKVSDYLPRLRGTDKEELKVSELLYHTSGLVPSVDTNKLTFDSTSYNGKLVSNKKKYPYTIKIDKVLWGSVLAKINKELFSTHRTEKHYFEISTGLFGSDSLKNKLADIIYSKKVGEKVYRYSCLNFCVLKDMEEALTGVPHDRFVDERVFGPIGANRSMFRPSDHDVDMENIAPTENDLFVRMSVVQGYVNDYVAAFLGGVSGNAGLFSTAGDIAKLCQTWLNGGRYGGKQIFKESTVRKFTTETLKWAKRGLGFDKPYRLKSLRDIGMSEASYGHTGFTGTCFWVDPENRITVVILSNSIYPSRDNSEFARLDPRRAILKAVYDSLVPVVVKDEAIVE